MSVKLTDAQLVQTVRKLLALTALRTLGGG